MYKNHLSSKKFNVKNDLTLDTKNNIIYNPIQNNNKTKKNLVFFYNASKNLIDRSLEIKNLKKKVSFVPSTREWKHSVYSYNKSNIRTALFKNKMLVKRMKGYFNLSFSGGTSYRSRRMRNLIRKSSSKRIFLSKPEIKETNDKVNVTVYTVNNERKEYNRKIVLANNTYSDLKKYNTSLLKNYLNNIKSMNKINSLSQNLKETNQIEKKDISNLIVDNDFSNLLNPSIDSKKANYDFYSVTNKSKIFFLYSYDKKKDLAIKYKKESLFFDYKLKKGIKVFEKRSFLNTKKSLKLNLKERKTLKPKNNIRPFSRFEYDFKEKLISKNYKNKTFIKRSWRFNVKNIRFFKKNLIRLLRKQEKNLLKNKVQHYHFNKLIKTLPFAFTEVKINLFKSKFMINFMLWSLASFGINIIIDKQKKIIIVNKDEKNINNSQLKESSLFLSANLWPYNPQKSLEKERQQLFFNKESEKSHFNLINETNLFKYKENIDIHIILWRILNIILSGNEKNFNSTEKLNTNFNSVENKISYLFKQFKTKFLKISVKDVLRKELLAITYLYLLTTTKFKFTKFLDSFKILISKIYSKKVELNLVNLKYMHLNSSILLEAISIKLRNKKNNLLAVMKKALKLVKIPKEILTKKNYIEKLSKDNSLVPLNIKKSSLEEKHTFNKTYSKDEYQIILIKIFKEKSKMINKYFAQKSKLNIEIPKMLYKIKDRKIQLLKNLKYKWVTGARIQGSGRLTRRFTASRAVFKDRIKGHLQDQALKNFRKSKSGGKAPSVLMLRNQIIPNLEHSLGKSKRRIGAFGLNVWISSN